MRVTPVGEEKPAPPVAQTTKSVWRSFRFAWEGLSFVFNTQRHMRVHVLTMSLVLLAALGLRITEYEFLFLLSAFAMVLTTEMINTALEQTIDLTVRTYDPRAKVAKDVAAAAVMIATAYAVVVGTLGVAYSDTFWNTIWAIPRTTRSPHFGVLQAVLIGAIFLGVFITWMKRHTGRGTFWRGGIISGHTALGFLIATSIIFVTRSKSIACLALALALLVTQSRVQARIHSPLEVLLGGVLGTVVGAAVFTVH